MLPRPDLIGHLLTALPSLNFLRLVPIALILGLTAVFQVEGCQLHLLVDPDEFDVGVLVREEEEQSVAGIADAGRPTAPVHSRSLLNLAGFFRRVAFVHPHPLMSPF